MEAATAGQAEAAEATTQSAENGQTTENQGPDSQAWQQSIDSRLNESADGVRQMLELVQARLPEPQAEPEPDFAEQFQEMFGDPSLTGIDPSQLQTLVDQRAEARAKELIAPLQQQFQGIQDSMTAEKLNALTVKFPELADETRDPRTGLTAADRLADQVVSRAAEWGAPQLANNPGFVEMVHRDQTSRQRAEQETPAGQGPETPHVEQGGGAAPASSEGDPWDAIAKSGPQHGRVW